MQRTILFYTLLLLQLSLISASPINILDYDVDKTGKELNTTSIQRAIDETSENGGGEIIFPPGKYLTGTIIIKHDVTLHFKKGATLLGSKDIDDYLPIKPRYIALRTQRESRQLIYAEDQENIGLTGDGTLDGQGGVFTKAQGDDAGITRPHLIQLINCRNVKIEGLFMANSGAWLQHYLACENMQIRGLRIYNHCNKNNDGLDLDGCKNVAVSDCIIDSDDDALCLKSTSPAVCENVVITNCVLQSHCNSLKMGTESTGGFRNITINNCVISPCADTVPIYGIRDGQSALSLEMVDGGVLEYVNVSNISVYKTGTPIFIRLGNRARKYYEHAGEPGRGRLHHVNISNFIACSESLLTSSITGLPENNAENIMLSDIQFIVNAEGTKEMAEKEVPESENKYPTPGMFGNTLPASCFYIRHVNNLIMDNVSVSFLNEDERPAFILDDVTNAEMKIHFTPDIPGREQQFKLVNSEDVNIIQD